MSNVVIRDEPPVEYKDEPFDESNVQEHCLHPFFNLRIYLNDNYVSVYCGGCKRFLGSRKAMHVDMLDKDDEEYHWPHLDGTPALHIEDLEYKCNICQKTFKGLAKLRKEHDIVYKFCEQCYGEFNPEGND